jgi:hypothetical protein
MPFHPLKTCIKNTSLFFILFSPSHASLGHADANPDRRSIFPSGELSFVKLVCHKLLEVNLDGCQVSQIAGDVKQ